LKTRVSVIDTVYPEVYPSDMPPLLARLEPSHADCVAALPQVWVSGESSSLSLPPPAASTEEDEQGENLLYQLIADADSQVSTERDDDSEG